MMSDVRRYEVRFPRSEWSVWLIDERTGTLVVFGDRETWSYTWGHAGRVDGPAKTDFRHELLRFSESYIKNKLKSGRPTELNSEATAKECRLQVLTERRNADRKSRKSDKCKSRARKLFDLTNEWSEDDTWFRQFCEIDPDAYELAVYRTVDEQHLDELMNKHWPRVRALMDQQVNARGAVCD